MVAVRGIIFPYIFQHFRSYIVSRILLCNTPRRDTVRAVNNADSKLLNAVWNVTQLRQKITPNVCVSYNLLQKRCSLPQVYGVTLHKFLTVQTFFSFWCWLQTSDFRVPASRKKVIFHDIVTTLWRSAVEPRSLDQIIFCFLSSILMASRLTSKRTKRKKEKKRKGKGRRQRLK